MARPRRLSSRADRVGVSISMWRSLHAHRVGGGIGVKRQHIRGRRQAHSGAGGERKECRAQAIPFAFSDRLLGAVASGAEIENLAVAGIKAKHAGGFTAPCRNEIEV